MTNQELIVRSPLDAARNTIEDVAELDAMVAGMDPNEVDASLDNLESLMKDQLAWNPFKDTAVKMGGLILPAVTSDDENILELGMPTPIAVTHKAPTVEGVYKGLRLHTTFDGKQKPQMRLLHVLKTGEASFTNQIGTKISTEDHVYVCGLGASIESCEFSQSHSMRDLATVPGIMASIDQIAYMDTLPLRSKIRAMGGITKNILNDPSRVSLRRQITGYLNSLGMLANTAIWSNEFIAAESAYYGDKPRTSEIYASDTSYQAWLLPQEFRYGLAYDRISPRDVKMLKSRELYLIAEDVQGTEVGIPVSKIAQHEG